MKIRSVLVLAAAVVSTAAVPATAAKALCYQVVDPSGDAAPAFAGQPLGSSIDALDILSGDIASGKKNVVAVMRLKSVGTDTTMATGATYAFTFSVGGASATAYFRRFVDGSTQATFLPSGATTGEAVHADVDNSVGTITWTIPRSIVPGLKSKGAKFSGFKLTAQPANNIATSSGTMTGTYIAADEAVSGRTYVDGTLTCLRGV